MHKFLKSIGYGKITSEKIWNHYLKETEKTYTHHELVALDREIDFCEYRRECGTGIVFRCVEIWMSQTILNVSTIILILQAAEYPPVRR